MYFLPSAPGANLRDKPEYGDRFQGPAESEVRWEAKPAPPRVVMSSVPWKRALLALWCAGSR